jgi:hypothetical protein
MAISSNDVIQTAMDKLIAAMKLNPFSNYYVNRRRLALHEAAHALAYIVLLDDEFESVSLGSHMDNLKAKQEGGVLGSVKLGDGAIHYWELRKKLILPQPLMVRYMKCIAVINLAGPVIDMFVEGDRCLAQSDIETVMQIGLDYQLRTDRLPPFRRWLRETYYLLQTNWTGVERIADKLLDKGSLTHAETWEAADGDFLVPKFSYAPMLPGRHAELAKKFAKRFRRLIDETKAEMAA